MHIDELVRTTSKPSRSHAGDSRGKSTISFDSHGLGEATGYLPNNVSNQNFVATDESINRRAFPQPLLPPQYNWQTSNNKVGFPPISSKFIQGCVATDIPQGVLIQAVRGILQFQEEIICDNSVKATNFSPTDFSHDMKATKVYPSVHVGNDNNHKALINPPSGVSNQYGEAITSEIPMGRELIPYGEGGSQDDLTSTENSINDQDYALTTLESIQEGPSSCQPTPITVAVPSFNSRKRAATQSTTTERIRRARISDHIKSLEELLPNSGKGNQESVMDAIIDYMKYLQLQIKVLSRSRLGGEATDDPFIHLEGFGHYLVHQQNLNEPLEEVIGQMMEENMPAVIKLLETKGLYVMPMSFSEGLSESIQQFGQSMS